MQQPLTRFFNRFQIDEAAGIIQKTSSHTDKFVNEIAWYQHLPPALRDVAAQVITSSATLPHPFLTLQYCPGLNLGEALLSDGFSLAAWRHVAAAINTAAARLHANPCQRSHAKKVADLRWMYLHKTMDRLQELRHQPVFSHWWTTPVTINGQTLPSLREMLKDLQPLVEALLIPAAAGGTLPWTIIHGDFYLGNMLYDPTTAQLKLVDPRGSFGPTASIFGDPRYDDAKLLHSLDGHYDWLIHDAFSLEMDAAHPTQLRYHIPLTSRQRSVTALLKTELLEKPGKLTPATRLIEALLFLSMVPLHADAPNAQIVMLAQGMEKFIAVQQATTSRTTMTKQML